jgi:hypothetical protein
MYGFLKKGRSTSLMKKGMNTLGRLPVEEEVAQQPGVQGSLGVVRWGDSRAPG